MKIDIDPKTELFKWGPLKVKMAYAGVFIDTILKHVKDHYPWPWPPNACVFIEGKMLWIGEMLPLYEVGLKYFKEYFLNLENYENHWKRWEDWVKDYEERKKDLEKTDIKKLTNEEFYKLLGSFYDLNRKFWLIVHVPEIANWGGEYLLRQKLKEEFGDKEESYLEILSAPVKFSFFQEEELDLLKLSLEDGKEKALEYHAEKYSWILNSYGGNRILDKDYFEDKLNSLLKENKAEDLIKEIEKVVEDNKKRKTDLEKELKLSKEIILIADQLSQSIWWQDLRKGYIWQQNAIIDRFLKEISKRYKWDISDLQWCWSDELLKISKGEEVDEEVIANRKNYFALFIQDKKMIQTVEKKEVKELMDTYTEKAEEGIDEIKGTAVSKGKAEGIVKIIEDPFEDRDKMEKGDILVTGMTSPEYIIVMRKAKAIITDFGGMTSHAAIVSRELKIPCIVNTRVATQVLKDGDRVEVDADNGIVRILD